MDMVCKQSTITAREIACEILRDVDKSPSIDEAKRISAEYLDNGTYISPEFLLRVWEEDII